MQESKVRIETKAEVEAYLTNLQYAIRHNASVSFQIERIVDQRRDRRYTNEFSVAHLFPGENPVDALKRELQALTVEDYMRTVADLRFPKRSEMREFGKTYNGADEVYIKIRVELLSSYGKGEVFIMSFHYAERSFTKEMFPYKENEEV